jgi:hypothetical protein
MLKYEMRQERMSELWMIAEHNDRQMTMRSKSAAAAHSETRMQGS